LYDGAMQAYAEFVESHNITEQVVLGKLGFIRRQ
jgi:hypothetical protein